MHKKHMHACADQEGGGQVTDLPERSKICRLSYQYWSGSPKKIRKLPIQHSMLEYHRPASETTFFNGDDGPFLYYLDHLSPHKKVIGVGPTLANLSGSAHVHAFIDCY